MEQLFNEGDCVALKSSQNHMMINKVIENDDLRFDGTYHCVWDDVYKKPHDKIYAQHLLIKVKCLNSDSV